MIVFKLDKLLEKNKQDGKNIDTMYKLTKATGVRPNTIGQWFNNETLRDNGTEVRAIRVDVLDAICKVLECEIGDIIEYIPD